MIFFHPHLRIHQHPPWLLFDCMWSTNWSSWTSAHLFLTSPHLFVSVISLLLLKSYISDIVKCVFVGFSSCSKCVWPWERKSLLCLAQIQHCHTAIEGEWAAQDQFLALISVWGPAEMMRSALLWADVNRSYQFYSDFHLPMQIEDYLKIFWWPHSLDWS